MKKGNLSEDTDKECLENGEIENCLNQQSNAYVMKQRQLGKIDGYLETRENEDMAKNEDMEENEVESVPEEIVNAEEVHNNVTDSVDGTRHNLNDEQQKIVEQLNEIMLEGKASDGIMFKKVDKKTLEVSNR